MNRGKALALGFFLTFFAMTAYAITTSEIWNKVFDSTNDALRINLVAP